MAMDWDRAIERYGEALRRIVALMLAMASAASTGAVDPARPTLPRHLYRAVLRILHPAESATRRLIVVASRGLVVPVPRLSEPRPPKRRPSPTGIVYPYGMRPGMRLSGRFSATPATPATPRPVPARIALPLCDTLRPPSHRPRRVPAREAPRITLPGVTVRHVLPPKPTRFDPIDATRLALRIAALQTVLDDLPKQALRFARWRARRDARLGALLGGKAEAPGQAAPVRRPADSRAVPRPRRTFRLSPLRPGRPPGSRRRDRREVHEVLADLQQLAWWVLEPDTS